MGLNIFLVSDIHGSEVIWKKVINIIKTSNNLNLVFINGDLSGKYLIPVIQISKSNFKALYKGRHFFLESNSTLLKFTELIQNSGSYFEVIPEKDFEDLSSNKIRLQNLFREKILERLNKWLKELTNSIDLLKIKVIVMPGNDDDFFVDDIIKSYVDKGLIYPLDEIIKISNYEICSLSYVNLTPWKTPREKNESELKKIVENTFNKVKDISKAICNFHAPPFNTKIDLAIIEKKKGGFLNFFEKQSFEHVGSVSIRQAFENFQPLLGLHGHIHEAQGFDYIGRTLVLNPGSEYFNGLLKGYFIELKDNLKVNFRKIEV